MGRLPPELSGCKLSDEALDGAATQQTARADKSGIQGRPWSLGLCRRPAAPSAPSEGHGTGLREPHASSDAVHADRREL